MRINIKAINEQELEIGDAFLCKNSKVIRFVGCDPSTKMITVMNSTFSVINEYNSLADIHEHYTINKIIKNKNLIISEVE